jgi:hypothetical protein
MGFVIGGVVNSPPEIKEPESPNPVQPVNSLAELRKNAMNSDDEKFSTQNTRNVAKSRPRRNYDSEENLVVVDGKSKKIGKQSKYLLDMLTIDD